MDMNGLAKLLMLSGIILLVCGLLLYAASHFHLPFFRLPGDIFIKKDNFSFSFPIVSCLLISLLLSILLNIFKR